MLIYNNTIQKSQKARWANVSQPSASHLRLQSCPHLINFLVSIKGRVIILVIEPAQSDPLKKHRYMMRKILEGLLVKKNEWITSVWGESIFNNNALTSASGQEQRSGPTLDTGHTYTMKNLIMSIS